MSAGQAQDGTKIKRESLHGVSLTRPASSCVGLFPILVYGEDADLAQTANQRSLAAREADVMGRNPLISPFGYHRVYEELLVWAVVILLLSLSCQETRTMPRLEQFPRWIVYNVGQHAINGDGNDDHTTHFSPFYQLRTYL